MLEDRDANGQGSGRASRASDFSAMSRSTNKPPGTTGQQDHLSASAPGIQSMLRTTTEMGNVVGLPGGMSDLANVPRAPSRRGGASSRMSTTSSISTRSVHAHGHQRQRHSSVSAARHSNPREYMQDVPRWVPDMRSPTVMNIPSSSPLVPLQVHHRDSHRSHSMTNTSEAMHAPPRLSANRSMGSLQGSGRYQRPRSPLYYPNRYGRHHQRPASPAWSEAPGSQSNRLYRQGHQGQHHHTGQSRMRVPSDTSLGYRDTTQDMPRRPSRAPSPALPHGYYSDAPPLPPLQQAYFPALEYAHLPPADHARLMNRSVKGSISSGSTNMRTDSDTPSSDVPFPPTPKDSIGTPMRGGPHGGQLSRRVPKRFAQADARSQPPYYGYSEPFDQEEVVEPATDRVPTGFVAQVKETSEDIKPILLAPISSAVQTQAPVNVASRSVLSIPELAASPVVPRLTRTIVLKGLEPASTTSDFSATRKVPDSGNAQTSERVLEDTRSTGLKQHDSSVCSFPSAPLAGNRHSIVSQPGTTLAESSTLDFAVRYSIPAMTGARSPPDLTRQDMSAPGSPGGLSKSTEDSMSELLAGYEHTGSQQGDDAALNQSTMDIKSIENKAPSRKSHAQNSSDGQSFKSCTGIPELALPAARNGENGQCFEPAGDARTIPNSPRKLANAVHTIQTSAATVDSLASKSIPKSVQDQESRVPTSVFPITSPKRALLRKPVPSQIPSSCGPALNARSTSRSSVRQGTISTSGSSSTLNVSQQPPKVPPRESSASKEAQRVNSVGAFLLRTLVPARIRNSARIRNLRNKTDNDAHVRPAEVEFSRSEPRQAMKETPEHSLQAADTGCKTPKKAPSVSNVDQLRSTATSAFVDDRTSQTRLSQEHPPALSDQHQLILSLRAEVPDYSSVYSPQSLSVAAAHSFPTQIRPSSSPYVVPKTQDNRRPDSQSSTHSSWHGRRSLGMHHASASEAHVPLPALQEDSTTDLRLSGYRYNAHHHLPDLKEESHEDSSVNTSASNLKHSHFRFPRGGGPSICASADDAIAFSRKSSMRSQRMSDAGLAHGLPSLEFSQGNLLEKMRDGLGCRLSRSLGNLRLEISAVEQDELPRRAGSAGDVGEDSPLGGEKGQKRPVGEEEITIRLAWSPLMAEVERITVPDVDATLTPRLSEIMPEFRRERQGQGGLPSIEEGFPDEKKIIDHALEEIKQVHSPTQKRSSARLRAMPGQSRMIMVDDDVYETMEWTKGDKRCEGETKAQAQGKNKAAATTTPTTSALLGLQPPSPAVLRPRSNTVAGNQLVRVSAESAISSRRSLRSFGSSPTTTDTRPWNSDKNYPWATTSLPSVDISLPSPVAIRNSPRPGPSHLRNGLSIATSSTFSSTHTPTASPFGITAGSQAQRNAHRCSFFGRGGDQAHAVGERYPTSALNPPTAIFRDLNTCDTSDDEDFTASRNKTKLGLRKRISSATRNNTSKTPRTTRSKVNPAELASPATVQESSTTILQDSISEARPYNHHRHTFRDAERMRTVVYHRHRIVDTIKRWWHKGEDLLKSLSRR